MTTFAISSLVALRRRREYLPSGHHRRASETRSGRLTPKQSTKSRFATWTAKACWRRSRPRRSIRTIPHPRASRSPTVAGSLSTRSAIYEGLGGNLGVLLAFDAVTQTLTSTLLLKYAPTALVMSPDGLTAYLLSSSGMITYYDVLSGTADLSASTYTPGRAAVIRDSAPRYSSPGRNPALLEGWKSTAGLRPHRPPNHQSVQLRPALDRCIVHRNVSGWFDGLVRRLIGRRCHP